MIICQCNGVSDRAIRKAVRDGARVNRNEVVRACTAGMACGGCVPAIDEIIDAEQERMDALQLAHSSNSRPAEAAERPRSQRATRENGFQFHLTGSLALCGLLCFDNPLPTREDDARERRYRESSKP